MITIIEGLLAILFIVCTGLFFLHKYDSEVISELEDKVRQLSDEVSRQNTRQWIYEQKLIKLSDNRDKIEIVHKYDDSDAPDYPTSRRS